MSKSFVTNWLSRRSIFATATEQLHHLLSLSSEHVGLNTSSEKGVIGSCTPTAQRAPRVSHLKRACTVGREQNLNVAPVGIGGSAVFRPHESTGRIRASRVQVPTQEGQKWGAM